MPSELIKEAAILAIHFSKYKGDHSGETYLAKKSQIKKRKGMPAGLLERRKMRDNFYTLHC